MSESSVVFRKFRFEAGGKKYELGRPDLKTEAGYSAHLEERAAQGINRNRKVLGEAGYRVAIEAWTKGFNTGAYGWMTQEFFDSLKDVANVEKLLWLWFSQSYPDEVGEEAVHEWYAGPHKADLDRVLSEMVSDPNPSGPESATKTAAPGNP